MEKITKHHALLAPIINSSMGNILEWYDFGLFSIFSGLFSHLFFPEQSTQVSLLATFGIFAIGFFCRPLGAIIFGILGDKQGRSKTLRLSILMISIPTLLIGFLPTYQQIGIGAPILLTLIRMWQGISIGGEYSGNIIYLAETAPKQHRGFVTSFVSTGANLGILLATLVGIITTSVLDDNQLHAWGWRLPYLLSGFLCILIYATRLKLPETKVFNYLKQKKLITVNPLQALFKNDLRQLLQTFGLVCMGTTFYYFCFVYLPLYLSQNLNKSIQFVSVRMTIFISIMILLVPLAGYICDRFGRRKMLLFNSFLVISIVIPGFYFLKLDNNFILIAILFIFTIASSLEQGTTCIAVVENFPAATRYTGVSLGYNLGNGLLGGTVPIICTWLNSKAFFSLAPPVYIAFCSTITFLVVYFFIPETRGQSLLKN